MAAEIRTLYDTVDPTLQIVPRTKVEAITDANNIPLSSLLAKDILVTVLTHIHNDEGHQLTGLNSRTGLVLCTFTAVADYVSTDTITLDSVSYTFKGTDGSTLSGTIFTTGSVVFGIVNTATGTFHMIVSSGGSAIEEHNTDESAHLDIRSQIAALSSSIPTIYSSTAEPTTDDGQAGDIWVVVSG